MLSTINYLKREKSTKVISLKSKLCLYFDTKLFFLIRLIQLGKLLRTFSILNFDVHVFFFFEQYILFVIFNKTLISVFKYELLTYFVIFTLQFNIKSLYMQLIYDINNVLIGLEEAFSNKDRTNRMIKIKREDICQSYTLVHCQNQQCF